MNCYRINRINEITTTEKPLKTQNYGCLLCPHCHKDMLHFNFRSIYLYQLHQKRVSFGHKPNHLYEINLVLHFHRENGR